MAEQGPSVGVSRDAEPLERPATLAAQLQANREALRTFEGSALAGVAESLARTAESLQRIIGRLEAQRPEEWMGAEQAARYLGMSPRAFKRIAPHLPRRYVSNQVILYPRSLVDEALYAAESPEDAIVSVCRHSDDKSTRLETSQGGTGAAESIRKALNKS